MIPQVSDAALLTLRAPTESRCRRGPRSDVEDFLEALANRRGRLFKGGVPDLVGAGKAVLRDWNSGRLAYHTPPPVSSEHSAHRDASIVAEWGKAFDWEAVLAAETDDSTMLLRASAESTCGPLHADLEEEADALDVGDQSAGNVAAAAAAAPGAGGASRCPEALHRFLARCGYSHVAGDTLVRDGRITRTVGSGGSDYSIPADGWEGELIFEGDTVNVDGLPLVPAAVPAPRVFGYHKAAGVIADADAGTILRAAGDAMVLPSNTGCGDGPAAQPVGQLDVNTTGLLLFTTCGVVQNYLLLPGVVPKTYIASYAAPPGRAPTDEQLLQLVGAGVDIARPGKSSEVVRFEVAEFVGTEPEPLSPTAKVPAGHEKLLYRVRPRPATHASCAQTKGACSISSPSLRAG